MMPDRGTCKGCRRSIVWVKTTDGKAMPCDPARRFLDPGTGSDRVVTDSGETVAGSFGQMDLWSDAQVVGRVPHWARCPAAGQFRKGE